MEKRCFIGYFPVRCRFFLPEKLTEFFCRLHYNVNFQQSGKEAIMKLPIVTISREFGSHGREIGEKVAKMLGVEFYDKKIIEEAAKESGL